MKIRLLLAATLALVIGVAHAQTPEQLNKMRQDQELCYGLAAMANSTVQQRNAGRTLEEQLERRRTSLGADTDEFKLVASVAQQVYDKDLRDPLPVAADTHRACLQAKKLLPSFQDRAVKTCPAVGLMVAEISAARGRGASVEEVTELLGDRYGNLAKSYNGGVAKLAAKYTPESKPDAGNFDYFTCMVMGMTGVMRP